LTTDGTSLDSDLATALDDERIAVRVVLVAKHRFRRITFDHLIEHALGWLRLRRLWQKWVPSGQ
jgi:hypothetical protein